MRECQKPFSDNVLLTSDDIIQCGVDDFKDFGVLREFFEQGGKIELKRGSVVVSLSPALSDSLKEFLFSDAFSLLCCKKMRLPTTPTFFVFDDELL